MKYITGEKRNQITLLPGCIEDYVGEDNPVRVIDAFVNQLDMDTIGFKRAKPNETGRPSYDPRDLLKLYNTSTKSVQVGNSCRNAQGI